MSLNRQELKVIQAFLRSQRHHTLQNKTWNKVATEWGIGKIHQKEYRINETERQALRSLCVQKTGLDPMTADLTGSRMDIARQGANEKLSNQDVFADMAQIARRTGPIIMEHGQASTPPNTLLSVNLEALSLENISQVVVIENGSAILYWDEIRLPEGVDDPLWVYRGHGSNGAAVRGWLKALPDSIERISYCDYDPLGITIGFDDSVFDSSIVPYFGGDEAMMRMKLAGHNKDEVFYSQCEIAKSQSEGLGYSGRLVLDSVLNHRWALTQESIIMLKIPVRRVAT